MKVIKTKISSASNYASFDFGSLTVDEIVVFNIYIQRDEDYVIIIEIV